MVLKFANALMFFSSQPSALFCTYSVYELYRVLKQERDEERLLKDSKVTTGDLPIRNFTFLVNDWFLGDV